MYSICIHKYHTFLYNANTSIVESFLFQFMKNHAEIIILVHREINLRTVVHLNAPYYLLQ